MRNCAIILQLWRKCNYRIFFFFQEKIIPNQPAKASCKFILYTDIQTSAVDVLAVQDEFEFKNKIKHIES